MMLEINGLKLSSQFKTDPHKMLNVSDYMVILLNDPRQPDAFQLTDDENGTLPCSLL